MSEEFLPNGYDVPNNEGKYMKLENGENRFRILCSPILGYEWWVNENGDIRQKDEKSEKGDKPVRIKMDGTMPADAGEVYKHFWIMVVWNYKSEKVQILQINQATIQRPLRALAKDEDWGSPVGIEGYDILITRTGEKLTTEYSVIAKPKKKLDEGIMKMYEDMNIDLNAIYEGKDPFKTSEELGYKELQKVAEELR